MKLQLISFLLLLTVSIDVFTPVHAQLLTENRSTAFLPLVSSVEGLPAFTVIDKRNPTLPPPPIILQYDPASQTGFNWQEALTAVATYPNYSTAAAKIGYGILYLQEAIQRMTGSTLSIVNSTNLTDGIVLTTLAGAPPDLRADPEIIAALASDGADPYNNREAFFIRSEPDRLLIVANTVDGLVAAVPELLESVGYEVLGMGPNWIHVPQDKSDQLVFVIKQAGRPSYYLRNLWATSGQHYGIGTIYGPNIQLTDPADEPVNGSYMRWLVGTRMLSQSMPGFPGHALQAYHRAVVEAMIANNTTDGFLATTHLADTEPPVANAENKGHLWIKRTTKQVFLSDGATWQVQNLLEIGVSLDLSVPLVRGIIFQAMQAQAEKHFAQKADELFVFATETEDGGTYRAVATQARNPNWYPEYLARENLPFAQPYALHQFQGLDQPVEQWDPAAPSDVVFGFNNWLLHEFDKWLATLPPAQQITATGQAKQALVRVSLYSYNEHDVPPNFNLDPRIRVMIAGFAKHRGVGKWVKFNNHLVMGQAFQHLLPNEPLGDYRILSYAYGNDVTLDNIPATWSAHPASLVQDYGAYYAAGFRAVSMETDFNFGKYGLAYYLLSKILWNANLTTDELDLLRDRWLQRAYGAGEASMQAYYNFMLTDNYPVNGPNSWARAIRLIDTADQQIDSTSAPATQRRLDDLKQFWYYYYLVATGKNTATTPELQEFAWKGQMSYMTAMHMVMRRIFATNQVLQAVPAAITAGPAQYTHAETEVWWDQLLAYWPEVPVNYFKDATLADGRPAAIIDLNDLVMVQEFQAATVGSPLLYNSYSSPHPYASFRVPANHSGAEIGFKLFWPDSNDGNPQYSAKEVAYGVERWNPTAKLWETIYDQATTIHPSVLVTNVYGFPGRAMHLVDVRFPVSVAGVYSFNLDRGGDYASLVGITYDLATGTRSPGYAFTFFRLYEGFGLTQGPAYFYIPQGTQSLDLEVWDSYTPKQLRLFTGLSPQGAYREVDIGNRGVHRISLQPGEDGSIALIRGNGFAFPYLYSVPRYWSRALSDLLVPRAIVEADGLTIVDESSQK